LLTDIVADPVPPVVNVSVDVEELNENAAGPLPPLPAVIAESVSAFV